MDRCAVAPQHSLALSVEIDHDSSHGVVFLGTFRDDSATSSLARPADNFWIVTTPWACAPGEAIAATPKRASDAAFEMPVIRASLCGRLSPKR